jgi:hypothetical protein
VKSTWQTTAAISFLLLCLRWSIGHTPPSALSLDSNPAARNVAAATVPVVVELFTSEGCSSCPPADALLAKLEVQQPVANTQIIALEEHVDYWNSEGWTDPFSGREWTLRQQEYADKLKNQNPYTPQMIVDGHTEFIGGNDGVAVKAIEKAATQPKAHVSVSVTPGAKAGVEQAIVVVDQLTATNRGDKPEVWLAVTEAGLHSAVSAGENAGRDLHHASIVRAFHKVGSINLSKETSLSATTPVHLDPSWKRQNLHIVVFVQEQKSLQILGAAAAPVGQ